MSDRVWEEWKKMSQEQKDEVWVKTIFAFIAIILSGSLLYGYCWALRASEERLRMSTAEKEIREVVGGRSPEPIDIKVVPEGKYTVLLSSYAPGPNRNTRILLLHSDAQGKDAARYYVVHWRYHTDREMKEVLQIPEGGDIQISRQSKEAKTVYIP